MTDRTGIKAKHKLVLLLCLELWPLIYH